MISATPHAHHSSCPRRPARAQARSPRPALPAALLLGLLALLAAPGCVLISPTATATVSASGEFMAVAALPSMLGMQTRRLSGWSACFSDADDTLLIVSRPQYQALLNGRRMDCPGEIFRSDGRLMIRRSLAQRISQSLTRALAPPPPQPTAAYNPPARAMRALVAVSAGHGGHDPGAMAADVQEKDLTLDIARRLATELRRHNIQPLMIRDSDVFVELNDRAAKANAAGAALFVAIHADANPDSSASGHTLYAARQASGASLRLARAIDAPLRSLSGQSRSIGRQDFRVLVRTRMPAVLVETGFLTNAADRRRLSTESYRQRLAETIAEAISNYLD